MGVPSNVEHRPETLALISLEAQQRAIGLVSFINSQIPSGQIEQLLHSPQKNAIIAAIIEAWGLLFVEYRPITKDCPSCRGQWYRLIQDRLAALNAVAV
jgi:hypothetical protein